LQQRYLGTKRFSLEGVTALIPLVDEILEGASQYGAVELVMGMSHRGRLNVVMNIARRAPEEVFGGFEDVDPRSVLGGGDVKYHMGATGEYTTRCGAKIHIHLVSNPSHLEAVDPVTVGRTRAKQERAGEGGSKQFLPLLVHGDGAFAGQGVFAETLNLADIPGYTVGGTVHVIVNNLIGFTFVPFRSPACPPAGYSDFPRKRRRRRRSHPRRPYGAGLPIYLFKRRGD
jgi:2-oxoglutarate dehydrogenase E1 component